MEGYTWTQTLSGLLVTIDVPAGTSRKSLTVDVASGLVVSVRGEVLVSGELHGEVLPDEITWTFEDGKVEVCLEKREKDWWPCVIKGHSKIDTTKIEPEKSTLGDLDAETRAMVEKMLVEQRQRGQGDDLYL